LKAPAISASFGVSGLTPAAEGVARAVGTCVIRTGNAFSSGDLSADRRVAGLGGEPPPVAALAFPLGCRGRTVGAVVGVDRVRSEREPKLTPATLAVLLSALEPGAIALDNALRVQRAEALSVTDDLTQLYNSRYLSQVLRRETVNSIGAKKIRGARGTHGYDPQLMSMRAIFVAAAAVSTAHAIPVRRILRPFIVSLLRDDGGSISTSSQLSAENQQLTADS